MCRIDCQRLLWDRLRKPHMPVRCHRLSVATRLWVPCRWGTSSGSSPSSPPPALFLHRIKHWTVGAHSGGLSRTPSTPLLLFFCCCQWSAPEVIVGDGAGGTGVTTASDVYMLGGLLFELLTGHVPYYWLSASPQLLVQRLRSATDVHFAGAAFPGLYGKSAVEAAKLDDVTIPWRESLRGSPGDLAMFRALVSLMMDCWLTDAGCRPNLAVVESNLDALLSGTAGCPSGLAPHGAALVVQAAAGYAAPALMRAVTGLWGWEWVVGGGGGTGLGMGQYCRREWLCCFLGPPPLSSTAALSLILWPSRKPWWHVGFLHSSASLHASF